VAQDHSEQEMRRVWDEPFVSDKGKNNQRFRGNAGTFGNHVHNAGWHREINGILLGLSQTENDGFGREPASKSLSRERASGATGKCRDEDVIRERD